MKLIPREEKFYDFFLQQVRVICEASDLLLEGAQAGSASLAATALKIRSLEQQGDEIIHEIYIRLNQTFITPMDPEDLHSLSSHLDDVMDGIEDSVHRMVSYRIETIPPTVVELCRIVRSCALALQRAFEALAKNERLTEHCIEI